MRRFVPLVGLLLIPFVFYWKLFAWAPAERKIFRGDFLNQHYIWKSYFVSRVEQGEIPLWNPHVLGGVPVHANPQVGLFYPPNYLLLAFEKEGSLSYLALEAFQLLHQVLATQPLPSGEISSGPGTDTYEISYPSRGSRRPWIESPILQMG